MLNEKDGFLCHRKRYKSNIKFLIDIPIAEYDITAANISVLADAKKISEQERELLRGLPKIDREITIGKWIRDRKISNDDISNGIADAKEIFMRQNNFKNEDIFLIDNDALFIYNKPLATHLKVGKFTEFRLDHLWTSYCRLSNSIELFYFYDPINRVEDFRAKGLGSASPLHENYISCYLKEFFYIAQTRGSQEAANSLHDFYDAYQKKLLDFGFYRRYSPDSLFDIIINSPSGARYSCNNISPWQLNNVDISYNAGMLREIWGLLSLSIFKRTKK